MLPIFKKIFGTLLKKGIKLADLRGKFSRIFPRPPAFKFLDLPLLFKGALMSAASQRRSSGVGMWFLYGKISDEVVFGSP